MNILFKTILISLIVLIYPALSEELSGRVVGIADGDTITIFSGKAQHKIRLYTALIHQKKDKRLVMQRRSFDALDRMALLWKGLFFECPKKAITYHFLPRRL